MSKITKKLKNAEFEYDEETKKFLIIDSEDGGVVELNKIYAFAFMRFVIRISQRNWLKGKKVIDKTPNNMLSCNNHEEYTDPNQTTISWDEENFAIDCTSNEPF